MRSEDYEEGFRDGWDKGCESLDGATHALGLTIVIAVVSLFWCVIGFLIGWYA